MSCTQLIIKTQCIWWLQAAGMGPPHYLEGLLASLVIWPNLSTSSIRINFFAFSTFHFSTGVWDNIHLYKLFCSGFLSLSQHFSKQVYGTTGGSYGAPSSGYGAPSSSYAAPSSSYGSRSNYDYPVVSLITSFDLLETFCLMDLNWYASNLSSHGRSKQIISIRGSPCIERKFLIVRNKKLFRRTDTRSIEHWSTPNISLWLPPLTRPSWPRGWKRLEFENKYK